LNTIWQRGFALPYYDYMININLLGEFSIAAEWGNEILIYKLGSCIEKIKGCKESFDIFSSNYQFAEISARISSFKKEISVKNAFLSLRMNKAKAYDLPILIEEICKTDIIDYRLHCEYECIGKYNCNQINQ